VPGTGEHQLAPPVQAIIGFALIKAAGANTRVPAAVKELCAVLEGEELSRARLLGSQMRERSREAPGETVQGECVELLFLQEEQAR